MPVLIARTTIPILSRYKIELKASSILGQGGMGSVFLAYDRLFDKNVAIKTINPSFVEHSSPEDVVDQKHRMFFREAMAHARIGLLHSDRIVPVDNYGIEDETPFMSLELVHGGSLHDRIKEGSRQKTEFKAR